jgi:uncharacterized protein YdhG (YjbR/CyaY superfamily)
MAPELAGSKVRAYFAALPPDSSRGLKKIRDAIRSAAPDAVEIFSYGMPGFRLDGRALVWYAAWKQHYGLYPISARTLRGHAALAKGFEASKGTIRFPITEPPPLTLVKRLVRSRVDQVRGKGRA